MNHRVIILETRKPANREERKLFGRTYYDKDTKVFSVFLDKTQSEKEMLNTIIHELLHVVCAIATVKPRLSPGKEEARIRMAADEVISVLTGSKRP